MAMGREELLLDVDEVLFPWAVTYRAYRKRRGLAPVPETAWDTYTIGEATIPGQQNLMEDFHSDARVLATPPLRGRAEDCQVLAQHFTLIACTSRYEATEGPGTLAWLDRWVPSISAVKFCGWHPESGRPSGKPDIAKELDAVALIDDTPSHLVGLRGDTRGFLVARCPEVTSAPGALPGKTIVEELLRLQM